MPRLPFALAFLLPLLLSSFVTDVAQARPSGAAQNGASGQEHDKAPAEEGKQQDLAATATWLTESLKAAAADPTANAPTLHGELAESFQQAVGEMQFRAVFQMLRKDCGLPLEWTQSPPGFDGAADILVQASGPERSALFLAWPNETGKIAGLRMVYQPRKLDWLELEARLDGWRGEWGIAGCSWDADGERDMWIERSRDRQIFPLGSVFKVYVLAELARGIGAGTKSWEQELAIETRLKSLPSGVMHDWDSGRVADLWTFASYMIGISDNTATDHLLDLVGREAVEKHLAEYRNSVASKNLPFLYTREMFLLKSHPTALEEHKDLSGLSKWWAKSAASDRRAFLDALHEKNEDLDFSEIQLPAAMRYGMATMAAPEHADIEWFARPRDLVLLYEDAWRGELIDSATSEAFRHGLGSGERLYWAPNVAYHGYKGGNETGLVAFTLLLELDDGRKAAVCVCRNAFPAGDTEAVNVTADWTTAFAAYLLDSMAPVDCADSIGAESLGRDSTATEAGDSTQAKGAGAD